MFRQEAAKALAERTAEVTELKAELVTVSSKVDAMRIAAQDDGLERSRLEAALKAQREAAKAKSKEWSDERDKLRRQLEQPCGTGK